MAIGRNDVHVDAALTNLSINYNPMAGGMVAEQAVNVLKVAKESDKYYKWDRDNAFRIPTTYRADGGEANEMDSDLSTATYKAEEYALKAKVTDRQIANADSILDLRKNKMLFVQNLIRLDMEKRVATLLTTAANYASANTSTLSGATQWDNVGFTGSIESDMDAAKEVVRKAIGIEPNIIIIPAAVAKVVKRAAEIRDLIKYTQNSLLVNGDLPPSIFNMKVLIPTAINVTTQLGAGTDTFADIWGKHVVLAYKPDNATIDVPAQAYLLRARNFEVRTWRDESKRAEWIECSVVEDEVMTSNVSGYLYRDVIA